GFGALRDRRRDVPQRPGRACRCDRTWYSPRVSALDVGIELARLVPAGELDELVTSITRALGGELAIFDAGGLRLAGAHLTGSPRHVVAHLGEPLAQLAATGPAAEVSLALSAETLDLLVHHAYARELAAATHEEAMRQTFAELTEHNARLQRAVSRLEE